MAPDATPTEQMTCEQLALSLGVPKEDAYCLVQFCEKLGWITKAGNLPAPAKRGRGATIYAVPEDLGDRLAKLWGSRKAVQ